MKRDIKLNMQALNDICRKINTYINALVQIETASAAFLETIKEQDSKACERLSGLWEEKVTGNERDLKEKLETIETVLSGYIMEMESHIAPKDPALQLRVDRNDIWWNYTQIAGNAMDFGDILRDESGSYVDYGGWYLYNPFEDEKTNEARKQAMEAEEAAERGRRERNYRKLAEFREMLRGKMNGSIQESVHAIEDIHKDKVIPFENTDDRYKKLIDTYYDEWKSFGDGFADFWDVVCDIGSGLFGAVKDLFVGVIDLLKGVVEIAGWLLLKVVQADKIGLMPEALEEDATGIFTGIGSILKDPGNALEAMGQSTFDNADEKGIAYSVSYVAADTAIGLLLDKGLKKLGKADDLVKPAGYSDEAADAVKYGDEAADAAMEAAERGDELARGAEEAAGYADEGGSGSVKPYANNRPSFRKGVFEEVWENAKGPDGLVRDPNTGDIINWNPGEPRKGIWDMGHIPEAKYSEMHEAYMNGDLTKEEFLDWYNDPNNYRPELPSNNRSHKYE